MSRFFALLALLGFTLSLVVHVAALFAVDVSAMIPFVWSLHIGVFFVFLPFAISCRKTLGPKPSCARLRALFPGWVVAVGALVFAYTIVNFMLFMLATQGGSPSTRDGKFTLENHGHLIREISASEYATFKINEIRGFSGNWLVFYFVPFAYFMFRTKSKPSGVAH